mgnify:CR=1 FL=1
MTASTAITPFNFNEHAVRVIQIEDAPWFVATDVAESLGYKSPKDAASYLDDDEKGSAIVRTPGGDQKLTVINESGLYALVLRSRKPEARKFAKWVTSEVLPAIRKTGKYERTALPYTAQPRDKLTLDQGDELCAMLETAAQKLPPEKRGQFLQTGWAKLKKHTGVNYRQIPQAAHTDALSLLARHVAEWELVDDTPKAGTVQAIVADWVKKIEEPNGYPAMLFEPIVEAVQRKMGNQPAQPDAARTKAAFDAASQAAASVQSAVFNAVLSGNDEWKYSRWVLAFIDDSAKGSPAYVRQLEHGSFTTTWPRLVRDVANGECMCTSAELLDMAAACMQRLQQRGGPARLAA